MMPTENLLFAIPHPPVSLMNKEGKSIWKRLWDGGREALGHIALTDRRLIFIRSKGMLQRLSAGPKMKTMTDVDQLLTDQGGFAISISEITSALVTARSG